MKARPGIRARLLATTCAAVATALFPAAAGAAGAADRPARGSHAGTVPGTRAFVAVVVGTNGRALALVCDGRAVAQWFRGRAISANFTLTDEGGRQLRVRIAGGRATGTVRVGGKQRPFATTRATRPAGLYRAQRTARGKLHVGGWIVLPDGRQRGAVRAGSRIMAAPLRHPAAQGGVTVGGVRLRPAYVGSGFGL